MCVYVRAISMSAINGPYFVVFYKQNVRSYNEFKRVLERSVYTLQYPMEDLAIIFVWK